MSSDTAKENVSVVDSSVSEWRCDMRNSDDPGSLSHNARDDTNPSKPEQRCSSEQVKNMKSNKEYGTRYFIIKSLNHQNIQLSIERGIWATQVMNEPILDDAFHRSDKMILIFSVNMSGCFQGYAQMMSSFGWRRENVWSQGNGGNNPWGRSFKVKWIRLSNLPFQKTLHLKNPLNGYKPVKISRDCQELPIDIGEALCELLDGHEIMHHRMDSRDDYFRDGLPSKRPCVGPESSVQDDGYMSWSRSPVIPSLQSNASKSSRSLFSQSESQLPKNISRCSSASELYNHSEGSHKIVDMDVTRSSQLDMWGFSADRSPLSSLTEDDFLEMSYEEYLEAHSRSVKKFHHPVHVSSPHLLQAFETPRSKLESSESKRHKENSCSRSRSCKRTHDSSYK